MYVLDFDEESGKAQELNECTKSNAEKAKNKYSRNLRRI
jgi:hypothetical protein